MENNSTVFNTISNNVLLFLVVFKFIAMIIGVLGNVTVMIYTIFLNKEKTGKSYWVGNLGLADLLVCLTLYPIWIVEFIQIILNIGSDQELFCKFSRATRWALMFASTAALLAITVDRYLYIVKPLRYLQIVTHRRVLLAVSAIWITACCLLIVQYIHRRSYGIGLRSFCNIAANITQSLILLLDFFPWLSYFYSTSTFYVLLENNVSVSWLKQRSLVLTILSKNQQTG